MREKNSKDGPAVELNDEISAPLSIKEAAQRLGRTEWWTRTHFKKVNGALVMPGRGGRGTRRYTTVTVPMEVFERELHNFRVKK